MSRSIAFFFCILASFSSFSQITSDTPWVWIKGDSVLNAPGHYGAKGVASAENNPSSRQSAVSWTDTAGIFWMFGGTTSLNAFNDLWRYDPATNIWTWVNGDSTKNSSGSYGLRGISSPANQPPARAGAYAWVDVNGDLWMFGGKSKSVYLPPTFSDLWRYHIASNTWTWIGGDSGLNKKGIYEKLEVPSNTARPGGRCDGGSWSDAHGNLWLFAGSGVTSVVNGVPLNDVWRYNIYSQNWAWMNGDSVTTGVTTPHINVPGSRSLFPLWQDTLGKIWIAGGFIMQTTTRPYYRNDMWTYDPRLNEFSLVKEYAVSNEEGTHSWVDQFGQLWQFGGYSFGLFSSHLLKMQSNGNYTVIKGNPRGFTTGYYGIRGVPDPRNLPNGRAFGVSWRDRAGNLYLFGGWGGATRQQPNYIGLLNDMWKIGSAYVNSTPNLPEYFDKLDFFPNPVTTTLHLRGLKIVDRWEELQIISLQGQPLMKRNIQNQTELHVAVDKLPTGVYVAVLRNRSGSKKVVKFMKR